MPELPILSGMKQFRRCRNLGSSVCVNAAVTPF